ncbi:MAG: type II toxin-antitoxin system YhaV family toxin [Bryobacteraceae bacterium]|jgi:toxin YhaV
MPPSATIVRNGWKLYAHPAFGEKLELLIRAVETLEKRQPQTLREHPKTKLLKRVLDLILVEIPRDPNAAEFQLGNTLGPVHRHWRRAKFLGRFRLFFRFSSAHKAIVYAWVNDETTLRKAGSRTDPYTVFIRKLQEGNPPDEWDGLLREANTAEPFLNPALKRKIDNVKG